MGLAGPTIENESGKCRVFPARAIL